MIHLVYHDGARKTAVQLIPKDQEYKCLQQTEFKTNNVNACFVQKARTLNRVNEV